MEKQPKAEECINNLCKIIDDYCKGKACPVRRDISEVNAIYMVFFKKNGRARIHLIGSMSIAELTESTEVAIRQILAQFVEEGNPLAS